MPKILLVKAQRVFAANALAQLIGEVFGVTPSIAADGLDAATLGGSCIVTGATGEISVSINITVRSVNLFCRLNPNGGVGVPLSPAEVELARQLSGNTYSGKVNLHLFPERKVTDEWLAGAIRACRHHLTRLNDGPRAYSLTITRGAA